MDLIVFAVPAWHYNTRFNDFIKISSHDEKLFSGSGLEGGMGACGMDWKLIINDVKSLNKLAKNNYVSKRVAHSNYY